MAKKKIDVLDPKAKAARQKKIAAVGAVLLIALLAYQLPKTMKLLNPKPVQHAYIPAVPAKGTAASTPTASAAAAPTATPAAASSSGTDSLVVNADLSPTPLEGQLTSFTLFASKDPFQQQATSSASGSSGSSASSGSSTSTGSSPKKPSAARNPGSAVPSGPSAPPPAAPLSATLSVNGVEQAVNVNSDFPAATPLFHLVSLTARTARVSIAGGSLSSGAPTVTLHLGRTLTLMNTADGTRYKLLLVSTSAGSAATTTAPASTSTPSTTTTAGG